MHPQLYTSMYVPVLSSNFITNAKKFQAKNSGQEIEKADQKQWKVQHKDLEGKKILQEKFRNVHIRNLYLAPWVHGT